MSSPLLNVDYPRLATKLPSFLARKPERLGVNDEPNYLTGVKLEESSSQGEMEEGTSIISHFFFEKKSRNDKFSSIVIGISC